jgi:hypothetical protein
MTNVPRTDPAQSLSEPPAIEVAQLTVALRMSGFRIALEAGMSDSRENPLNIPRTIDGIRPFWEARATGRCLRALKNCFANDRKSPFAALPSIGKNLTMWIETKQTSIQ